MTDGAVVFAAMRAYALCERSLLVLFIVMLSGLTNPIIMLVSTFIHDIITWFLIVLTRL